MLCEVETAITNLGIQLPKSHKAVIVTESSNWAKEGDLTLMLIQDSGVLHLYQAFLNDWIRAFRNATAIGTGTCDPRTVQPLNLRPRKVPGTKKVVKGPLSKRPRKGYSQKRVIPQGPRRPPRKRLLRKKLQNSL